jgi:hypothetical protein
LKAPRLGKARQKSRLYSGEIGSPTVSLRF